MTCGSGCCEVLLKAKACIRVKVSVEAFVSREGYWIGREGICKRFNQDVSDLVC